MKAFYLALALLVAAPARAQDVDRWRPYIAEASLRFGVPTSWIERVMRAESGGWTRINGSPIRSRAGAIGLMQLMPATWVAMQSRMQLGVDPDDPRDNILAGTFYLRLLYDRFGYPGLFAAYNAGPGRYADFLASRQPLPGETERYLQAVREPGHAVYPAVAKESPPTLFVVRSEATVERDEPAGDDTRAALFAIRHGDR